MRNMEPKRTRTSFSSCLFFCFPAATCVFESTLTPPDPPPCSLFISLCNFLIRLFSSSMQMRALLREITESPGLLIIWGDHCRDPRRPALSTLVNWSSHFYKCPPHPPINKNINTVVLAAGEYFWSLRDVVDVDGVRVCLFHPKSANDWRLW